MIVVLEGPDKCGKSTLAAKLRDEHGFTIVKCSVPDKDPYLYFMEKLDEAQGDVVLDRFAYSGMVYGPIYRNKSDLTPGQLRNLELKLMSRNALVIYCYDNVKAIQKRFKTEHETYAKEQDVKRLLDGFALAMLKCRLPVFYHQMQTKRDYTRGKHLAQLIHNTRLLDIGGFNSAIGNPVNPAVVLVGERRNQKQPYQEVQQPFDFGPASDYLFEQLEAAKVPLDQVLIVNSDAKDLQAIISWVGKSSSWVALGNVAADVLTRLNVAHVKAPHPQYLKRFKRGSTELRQALRDAYKAYAAAV